MKIIISLVIGSLWVLSAKAVSLDQAVESTLLKNEIVGQNRAQLTQAQEIVSQARGAVLPNLSLNGSYLLQPEVSDPVAAAFFPKEQKTVNLTLTQPLFRGLREFAALRRENNNFESKKQIYLSQMILLYQNVAQSFMDVLMLEQDIRNITAQQKIYQTRIKDLQGRARRGESSSTEALTAQSTAAALDAEYQIQNSKLRTARQNFSFLTGLPLNTELNDDGSEIISAPAQSLETYLSRINERPDVKEKKEEVAAAEEDVSIARGAHWPTADFIGNYYFLRPEGFSEDLKWDIQLRISLPIYEGGITQSRVRNAASRQGEMQLALNQLRRKAESEIKSLYESVRLRADQLKFLKLSSDLAEKNYQGLVRDSRRGLVRSIDVQLGLTEYRLAKRTYDQARFDARIEKIRLDLASAIIPPVLSKDL